MFTNIKIILLSIKIKIFKLLRKNYDPFGYNINSFCYSPSYFLLDEDFKKESIFQLLDIAKERNEKNKLKSILNLKKSKNNLNILKKVNFEINKNLNRNRIIFKYSKFIDFPIDVITKNNTKYKAIVICLQGANSGAHINYNKVLMPNDYKKVKNGGGHAIYAALNNCIGVSYERIGYGERREKIIRSKFKNTATYNIDPSLNFLLFGRTLLGQTIDEIDSLVDFLKIEYGNLPVYIMGYSDGGTIAMAYAAVKDNINGIAISGCIGYFKDTILKRTQTGLLNIPNFLKYFDTNTFFELSVPKYCLIVSGTNDHIWPYKLTKKVIDDVKVNKKNNNINLIKVEGGHTYYPDVMWENLIKHIDNNKY